MEIRRSALRWMTAALVAVLLGGCATTAQTGGAYDPLQPINRKVFAFNTALDQHLIGPVSKAYVKVTPAGVRTAVTNFFANAYQPWVVINDVLQLKMQQAVEDTGRFVFNTTFGLLGFIDVSTGFGLPAHHDDMGMTLAHWGVGAGPYLVLPVLGPTTLRDAPDVFVRSYTTPLQALSVAHQWELVGVQGINTRANVNSALQAVYQSLDPYVFMRESYLQRRNYLIHGGNAPAGGGLGSFDASQ